MMDGSAIPTLRTLWPRFSAMGTRYKVDGRLLAALAYIQSGLDPSARSASGAAGLMQMMPSTADEVAKELGRASYDLADPAMAIELGARYLGDLLAMFGTPRLGVAAYVAGPGAVRNAGGQVPGSRDVQRTVRDVLVVWQWLLSHLSEMLHPPEEEGPSIGSSVGSTAASGSSVSLSSGGPAGTATTSSGPSRTVSAPAWRLVAPPEDWRNAEAIDASELPVLERLAARLGLRHHRDDVQRKVYVGVPGSEPVAASGRLIVPVPGATAKNSGAYPADTGLDIIVPVGSPVVAAGSGKIVYSEHGHTPWVNPPDTPNSILIRLDTPFVYQGRMYPFTWYTHLSRLRFSVPDDGPHVAQGETIGWTGTGNRVPHLHFGVVYDRPQTVYVPPLTLAAYFGWTSR